MGEGFIIIYQQIDKDVKVEWKGINRQKNQRINSLILEIE